MRATLPWALLVALAASVGVAPDAAAQQLRCGLGGHGHAQGSECQCDPGFHPETSRNYRICAPTRAPRRPSHSRRNPEPEQAPAAPAPVVPAQPVYVPPPPSLPFVPSCPDGMVRIPGGTFWMGSAEGDGDADEHPAHRVTLSSYCIDRTEVTVAAYRRCAEGGGCQPAPCPTLASP